jgi:hypothetical protein
MTTATQTKQQIEDRVLKYFQNKEIAKERSEENKLIIEEIEQYFDESGGQKLVIDLPNGEFGVLDKKMSIREVLDKEALALEIQISKDELKTPFDFSMLTKQEKLTPALISKYTNTETKIGMKLGKSKKKPKNA